MAVRPWQVVALATLCFIQALHLFEHVLSSVLAASNHSNVVELAENGIGGDDANAVYQHLSLSQDVFGLMAVVVLMFGVLLYRNQYLPGVRLTGTIYAAVGLIGQVFLTGSTDEGSIGAVDNTFSILFTVCDRFGQCARRKLKRTYGRCIFRRRQPNHIGAFH